jgi:hypothetical protein
MSDSFQGMGQYSGRDLIGYGQNPPDPKFPKGAKVALQIVLNYEGETRQPYFLTSSSHIFIQYVMIYNRGCGELLTSW